MLGLGLLMIFLIKNLSQRSFVLNLLQKKTLIVLKLNSKKLWNQMEKFWMNKSQLLNNKNHKNQRKLNQRLKNNENDIVYQKIIYDVLFPFSFEYEIIQTKVKKYHNF